MNRLLLAFILAAVVFAAEGQTVLHLYPCYAVYNSGKSMEGVYLYFSPSVDPVWVTIEAEAEGKRLPTVTGMPNPDSGFLAAPIRDLDSYRILRLSVKYQGRTWILDHPQGGKGYPLSIGSAPTDL